MLPSKYPARPRCDYDDDGDADDQCHFHEDNVRFRHRSSPSLSSSSSSSSSSLQSSLPSACMPMCLTGVLCESKDLPIPNRGSLHYTIFRPRHLQFKPPLVCIAGGPLLPCTYLQPIVHLITDRSVVFYDALGCGQSKLLLTDHPQNDSNNHRRSSSSSLSATAAPKSKVESAVQIPEMVLDLQCLIHHLSLPNFHLLGHSFGGILAYEYLKLHQKEQRQKPSNQGNTQESSLKKTTNCLSLIMVSTPVSIADAVRHSHELQDALRQQQKAEEEEEMHKDDDHDRYLEETMLATYARLHECRMDPLPLPLQQSLAGVFSSTTSKGLDAVRYYTAAAIDNHDKDDDDDNNNNNSCNSNNIPNDTTMKNKGVAVVSFPPALILRGEYDFVSHECQEKWANLLSAAAAAAAAGGNTNVEFVTLPNSAHYGMLENETEFADAVRRFLPDPPEEEFITLPNGVKVRR